MKHVTKLVKLQLIGLNGNAFALMGAFQQAARRQGTPKEEIKKVLGRSPDGADGLNLCFYQGGGYKERVSGVMDVF